MKKIKLYITASLDNYIAPLDGDMEWLVDYPRPSKEDYNTFYDSIDTVIMGGNTYLNMFCMDILWPYKDKTTYIVTCKPTSEKENINYITTNIIETISQLKQGEGKDIWLVGGGELTKLLHEHNLIDEIIVTYIPVTLDKGVPLFSDRMKESDWVLKEKIAYGNAEKRIFQIA